jgi:hypothetical protein
MQDGLGGYHNAEAGDDSSSNQVEVIPTSYAAAVVLVTLALVRKGWGFFLHIMSLFQAISALNLLHAMYSVPLVSHRPSRYHLLPPDPGNNYTRQCQQSGDCHTCRLH